mmetsp:Transcript_36242/g.84763  ORF Transcript_36242/g.84763 Transcript_36242/m.84763 type:complete len:278 (+) Transcript_36242:79-912(+)
MICFNSCHLLHCPSDISYHRPCNLPTALVHVPLSTCVQKLQEPLLSAFSPCQPHQFLRRQVHCGNMIPQQHRASHLDAFRPSQRPHSDQEIHSHRPDGRRRCPCALDHGGEQRHQSCRQPHLPCPGRSPGCGGPAAQEGIEEERRDASGEDVGNSTRRIARPAPPSGPRLRPVLPPDRSPGYHATSPGDVSPGKLQEGPLAGVLPPLSQLDRPGHLPSSISQDGHDLQTHTDGDVSPEELRHEVFRRCLWTCAREGYEGAMSFSSEILGLEGVREPQ